MNLRRALLALACVGALAGARSVTAQQRVWRIGFLYFASRQSAIESGRYAALLEGLRDLGYLEGRDFIIEARYGDGKSAAVRDMAAQLVQARVDVIVTGGTPAAKAAQHATKSVPIVFASSADPVRDGLVTSLARPGANVTGLTSSNAEVDVKHVELLKSVKPAIARIAVLINPANSGHVYRVKGVENAAAGLGIKVLETRAETSQSLDSALAAAAGQAQGLIILNDSFFLQQERTISRLALQHRLPAACSLSSFAEAGLLMSYGPSVVAHFRRAAVYVDKIIKGAKPADLPVERARVFDLVVNSRTAEALGVTIPKEMLFMAVKVIR